MRIFLKPKNGAHWHVAFKYEPSTGNLINRYSRAAKAQEGRIAGGISDEGYIVVGFCRRVYQAHRIIWEMVHGPIPDGMEIDHINGVRDDNRLVNLRLATSHENHRNRKRHSNNISGFHGVGLHKRSGKYQARIYCDSGRVYLGLFDTAEQASQAYQAAARELGYHKNHGRAE